MPVMTELEVMAGGGGQEKTWTEIPASSESTLWKV
jgi:hypothetical protein